MRPEFVAGFAVAEGSFVRTGRPRRHSFTIALGSADAAMCDALRAFFGVGHVYRYPPRRPGTEGAAIFTVQRRRDLIEVVVPFLDAYLPSSRKLRQYQAWRASLLAGGYSPDASGRSAAIASQSSRGASDQSRSRS